MSGNFREFMEPGKRGYLIGIGGVSMSPLAEVLSGMGLDISGSDIQEGENVKHLKSIGFKVNIGHYAENIKGDIDFIVRTAAVRDDNVEIIAARAAGIPVFERTETWGAIMRDYKNAVCVAGTHGKTTTTSMVTHIFMAAGRDPTVMIGGTLPLLSSSHRVGEGDTIILESCEYYNSFHSFIPTVAVILNIEADHLDFFKDLDAIKDSFRQFAANTVEDGIIVANAGDENTMSALRPLERELFTFSLDGGADVYASNLVQLGAATEFDILLRGELLTRVRLRVPGLHNVKNALAASAAALCLKIPADAIKAGLESFTGAERRFEYKGSLNGADIYDDYAHHPGELNAVFNAVEPLGYKRVIAVFQPHTYSRTKALFDGFVEQLKRPDITFLAEIYAARESNTEGISSADLAERIPGSEWFPDFGALEDKLRRLASPGDIILTIGAGDVYKVGEAIVE